MLIFLPIRFAADLSFFVITSQILKYQNYSDFSSLYAFLKAEILFGFCVCARAFKQNLFNWKGNFVFPEIKIWWD